MTVTKRAVATSRLVSASRCRLTGAALLLFLGAPGLATAQTTFWTEDFNNGCAQLCLASGYAGANGSWAVVDVSAPGSAANTWFVSCAENGNPAGSCGSACANDASLHIANVDTSPAAFLFCPTGDCGAAYDATDASCVSDQRAVSPLIDATGKTGLSVQFVYLGGGQPCADAADFEWSGDGGANWTALATCLQSNNAGCGGQGRWTANTVALPAAADNNSQNRLAFHWHNNGDGLGNDPSFAVDDVSVRYTPVLAVDFGDVAARRTASGVEVRWATVSEQDSVGFRVLRATNAAMSEAAAEVAGFVYAMGSGSAYQTMDLSADANTSYYYQVQEISSSGPASKSAVARVDGPAAAGRGSATRVRGRHPR